MAKTIGIDFGTTKTMVSYLNPATGRVELVTLDPVRDRTSIPTTVHVDEAGLFLFGEDADDQIQYDPEGYCRAFKLHLGENDSVLPRANATAEFLAAMFLRHIKNECEQTVFHGESITSATITIPVIFSPSRKAALKRAAEAAGFSSVSFLPEPEAAGTAFLRDNPADKFSRALVLDWGGGTLDIAIISRDENGTIHADRHCAEGRDDVGGEEMDRGLLENLNALWIQTFGSGLLSTDESEPKLLREAEKVKIGLSRKEVVPFRRGPKKIDISRDQFNVMVEQLLDAAVELVRSALSKNKAKDNPEPEAILLIGGTCQSPIVRETMERAFPNIRVLSWHHSHEAVALGAMSLGKTLPNEKAVLSDKETKPQKKAQKESGEVSSDSARQGQHSFMVTDEAIRLFAKFAAIDDRRNQKERNFMEEWHPGACSSKQWTQPFQESESIESLAAATAESYGNDQEHLGQLLSILRAFAVCDGPVDDEEKAALQWTSYIFGRRSTKMQSDNSIPTPVKSSEEGWRDICHSKRVILAAPVALGVGMLAGLVTGPSAAAAHVGKSVATMLFGKKK